MLNASKILRDIKPNLSQVLLDEANAICEDLTNEMMEDRDKKEVEKYEGLIKNDRQV